MDTCDVVIIGGGPAGSSCAWKLQQYGYQVAILDKHAFPRDKVCGGWITPAVLAELEIDPAEYALNRVLQPITGFRTGSIGGGDVETRYGEPVSYGIRRCEFDDYLLKRSGARLLCGEPVNRLELSQGQWTVNGRIRAPMLVGAGGTFCPVAHALGARVNQEIVVAAQEAEFEMDQRQQSGCSVRADTPELYFCPDLRGYGWCFRKKNVLNVGLGRLDRHGLARHVSGFLKFLAAAGKFSCDVPLGMTGHAYLLYGHDGRTVIGEGVLLAGDAAGLAYAQSGEGIRPAVESGLLAAKAIHSAEGRYSKERLEPYRASLGERFGGSDNHWLTAIARRLPAPVICSAGRRLLASGWFARRVVLDGWFLHLNQPALELA